MSQRFPTVYLALFAILIAALSACSSPNPAEEEKHAIAAADQWLSLIDSGNYEQAWANSDDAIKSVGSKQQFADAMARMRSPFGKELSRQAQDKAYAKDPQNAAPGEYVQVHFHSSFQNAKSVDELVTLKKQADGSWKVGQYVPKPEE